MALQFVMVGDMRAMTPPEQTPPEFATMIRVMQAFTALFALGIAGPFGWIIHKLTSARVKAEFS